MLKKPLIVLFAMLFLALSASIVVSATNILPSKEKVITEAIMAADVCSEHLDQECLLCDGIRNSYHEECTVCGTTMTLCCSGVYKEDDHYAPCYVSTHPKTCQTVQDLLWNAYFCPECGNYKRGGQDSNHTDDYHIEAYWHTQVSCYNHT